MKRLMLSLGALALSMIPASAEDECKVKGWGLSGETPACFSARVVDILCEIIGDCPDKCGDGKRQLGLVRADDGKLIYPQKNIQAAFNGAVVDLLPHCGNTIEVRGSMVGDEETLKGAAQLFHLHQLKPEGGEWKKANDWVKAWNKANPEAKGKGPWFRRSPRIKADIEENGYLGLGPEKDIEFIKDWY